MTGAFDGDAAFEGTSSGELTVTVTKCDTSYTVRDASGRRSETVPLHCWVKRATDGAPVVGVPVKLIVPP